MPTATITASGLTLDQERFCQQVIATNGNATEAWKRLHPDSMATPESINELASRWLRQVEIQLRIQQLATEALDAEQVTASWIVGKLRHEAVSGDLSEPNHARIRALEVLARWRGMLVERSESLTLGSVELRVVYDAPRLADTAMPQLSASPDTVTNEAPAT